MFKLSTTPSAKDVSKLAHGENLSPEEASEKLWRLWKIANLSALQTELTKIENGRGNAADVAFLVRTLIAIQRNTI